MPLAQLDDVKRVLQIVDADDTRDGWLRESLKTAEDRYVALRGKRYDVEGAQTEIFYDVREDAEVYLTAPADSISEIRVFDFEDETGMIVQVEGWSFIAPSRVRLRPILTVTPLEGAEGSRYVGTWTRLEVDYVASGAVPSDVRDGIALLAASIWSTSPHYAKGLTSESLGDYSYSLAKPAAGESYYGEAMNLLRPHLIRKVQVT